MVDRAQTLCVKDTHATMVVYFRCSLFFLREYVLSHVATYGDEIENEGSGGREGGPHGAFVMRSYRGNLIRVR